VAEGMAPARDKPNVGPADGGKAPTFEQP
jgi:hypothetical protein